VTHLPAANRCGHRPNSRCPHRSAMLLPAVTLKGVAHPPIVRDPCCPDHRHWALALQADLRVGPVAVCETSPGGRFDGLDEPGPDRAGAPFGLMSKPPSSHRFLSPPKFTRSTIGDWGPAAQNRHRSRQRTAEDRPQVRESPPGQRDQPAQVPVDVNDRPAAAPAAVGMPTPMGAARRRHLLGQGRRHQ
jgi:hypothetical protein